jgi:hypothetical protein
LLDSIKGRKVQSVHSYKSKSHGRTTNYRVKVWSVSPVEDWHWYLHKSMLKRTDEKNISRT